MEIKELIKKLRGLATARRRLLAGMSQRGAVG